MITYVDSLDNLINEMIAAESHSFCCDLVEVQPVMGIIVGDFDESVLVGRMAHFIENYQPIQKSYFTTVKAISCQQENFRSTDNILLTKKPTTIINAHRQFIKDINDTRRGRFTWILLRELPIKDKLPVDIYYAKVIVVN